MTGNAHRSDETHDLPQEHHSDAESLRHIPDRRDNPGVVQDGPGTQATTFEHEDPSDERNTGSTPSGSGSNLP
ncbi:hypothetical protein LAJ19_07170 [Deinococcus taeanensis]|uniref:hypothetical protein n=1 Tax=Deinococcus taeanensis TaxID=2737050 RepID=UPI001CDB817A|nr:hypothetical protein [Deinococcus taeanensis]UBV41453.1 hypothetical protein LAJ19_07170 [Deinococcus taeanensis]